MINEAIRHIGQTWNHVLTGHSNTSEKIEFGVEVGLAIAGTAAAAKFGIARASGTESIAKLETILPGLEIRGGSLSRQIETTLADVPQITESNITNYTRKTLPDIVEQPLVKAATVLYDKNIQTIMSSANGITNGESLPAYLQINYDTLSKANKAIAEKIGTVHPANGHISSTYAQLSIPVSATTPVSEIEARSTRLAEEFEHQPLTWGHVTADEFSATFMQGAHATDEEYTEFTSYFGRHYDPVNRLIFENEELARKYSR